MSPASLSLPSSGAPLAFDCLRFFPVAAGRRARLRRHLGFSGLVLLVIDVPAAADRLLHLLDAFAHVARREAAAHLRLAIAPPVTTFAEREQLAFLRRRAAESPYADRIMISSIPTEAERPDVCRAADVFVSIEDSLPGWRNALEAMACGLPAVLPDAPQGLRGLAFGRHALTADATDATDLGVTLMTIFRDPQIRTRLARMGAQYARNFLAWSGAWSDVNAEVPPVAARA